MVLILVLDREYDVHMYKHYVVIGHLEVEPHIIVALYLSSFVIRSNSLPLQEIYDTVGYTPVHLEKMASRSSQALASASSSKFGRASPVRAPSRLQPSPLVRHHHKLSAVTLCSVHDSNPCTIHT